MLNEQWQNVIRSFTSRGNFPPIRKKEKNASLRFYLQICCTWAIWKRSPTNLFRLLYMPTVWKMDCAYLLRRHCETLSKLLESYVPRRPRPRHCKHVSLKIDGKIRGRVDSLWPSTVSRFWRLDSFVVISRKKSFCTFKRLFLWNLKKRPVITESIMK